MNKDRLEKYFRLEFDDQAVEQLQELVDTYPYFQAGHALLAKASKEQGHHRYDEYLQKAAIYSSDRKALFDLIMRDKIADKILKVEQELEQLPDRDEPAVSSEVTPIAIAKKTQAVEKVKGVEEAEAEVGEEAVDVVEEDHQDAGLEEVAAGIDVDEIHELGKAEEVKAEEAEEKEDPGDEVISVSEEEAATPVDLNDMDDLQKDVLVEAVSRSLELEVGQVQEQDQPQEQSQEQSQVEVLDAFAQWVYNRAVQMNYTTGEVELSKTKAGEISDPSTKSKSAADLVDRFIQNDPKITPGKLNEYQAPERAADALLEDDEWVTETLAKVYAQQGNLRKAKKAYKLLALKFPEKSVYFANQIKKLGN
ncbi:MAG: hypothetical protein AAF193_07480 [Bacteroidota bacterium]